MEWAPDKQLAPEADARYRIHKSVKCYVASMQCGTGWCTLYLDNSIERVVHQFPDGTLKILYKNSFYPLHEPSELEKIVREHLALKGGIHIPGGTIHYNDKNLKFTPFHFINVTSKAEAENYNRLRPIWIASKGSSSVKMGRGRERLNLSNGEHYPKIRKCRYWG